jgi:hypothetical protein
VKARDLVLHVGMQQCGATMLQRALASLRPQLRSAGFGFVSHGTLAAVTNIDGWMARSEPQSDRATGFVEEVAALVDEELSKVQVVHPDDGTVLISSDHLLGSDNLGPTDLIELRPRAVAAIEQMISAVDTKRVTVVLHTQRQDRLMEFCYLREVMAGAYHHVDAQFPGLMSAELDYVDLIHRIENIARVDRVVVRPYELIGAGSKVFVADFLRAVGAPSTIAVDESAGLTPRVAYTPQGLQLARAMNPHLDDATERKRVRNFLRANYATEDETLCEVFTYSERTELLARHSERNEELFRTWLPEFPSQSYARTDTTAAIAQSYLIHPHDQT